MLTIKPPIKLRCQFPLETVHKDLSEKIVGNYSLMNNFIRKEELLYVTTQAPEVYFAEGSNISIFNDIKNENNQEIRLDVINHLINRILMSGTENFSYQDTVYISNVLRKLGIQDVSSFMKQVYKLQEERKENNKLINIYEEQKELLISIFNEEVEKQDKRKSKDDMDLKESSVNYHLHQNVFNRLNTEKVYEDIRNFTQGLESTTSKIFNNEMAVSEQISMISNFNLNNLKNKIMNKNEPIYYYHANQYELVEENISDNQTPEERITSAILLNLVDQIYSMRINQIESNAHNWYSIAGSLFQTSENTWKRYETNHKEGKKVLSNMYDTMVEIVNNKQNERNIITNIVNELKVINEENISELNNQYRDDTFVRNTIQNIIENKNISLTTTEYTEEIINSLNNEFNINSENNNINYAQVTDLTYLEQNNNNAEFLDNVSDVTYETVRNLEEINRRNIENYKKILEIEKSRPKLKDIKLNKEKARENALRALESPEEVLIELMNSKQTDEYNELNIKLDEQFYNLLSEETKNIFMQVSQQKRGEVINPYQAPEISHKGNIQSNGETEDTTSRIEKEVINNVVKYQKDSVVEMIQKPSVSYEINEYIRNEINELRKMNVTNLYENYFLKEEKPKKKRGRKSKAAIELEKKKERENLELQHFMNNVELEEGIVNPTSPARTIRTQNAVIVHKVDEQIITEDLLNTIRSKNVENVKEETTEHNQIHNINKNEKQISETINQIRVHNQENIDEIVKQNVKKQLNQLTDQVYGKIEKKLQTERKRRGY